MRRQMGGKVVIIIPNLNGKEVLKACINSILQHTTYPDYEIILVDNGSTDGAPEMVEQLFKDKVHIIRNKENLGFSKAFNQGVRESNGDYYLSMGNDMEIPPKQRNWLTELVSIAESDPKIGFVSPKIVFPETEIVQDYGAFLAPCGGWWKFLYPKFVYHNVRKKQFLELTEPTELDLLQGFIAKRKLLDEVGSYDEGYSPAFNEEFDWCIRAKLAGYKMIYDPRVVLCHHMCYTAKKLGSDWEYFTREKNDLRYILLNFPIIWLVLSAPTFLKQKLSKAWKERRFGQLFRAWMVTIDNLGEIWVKRKARMKLAAGWGRLFKK